MKVKNEEYRRFLDQGIINLITPEHIGEVLKNVDGIFDRHIMEGKALIIALYYTGARPAEVLNMEAGNIKKEGNNISIFINGQVKKSLPRYILVPIKRPFIIELFKFSQLFHPTGLLFAHYRSNTHRVVKSQKNGTYVRLETSQKVYYHLTRWFSGVIDITPYVLRHSKFSKLIQKGASIEQIRQLKGARRLDSVFPYSHMSSETSKKLARLND